MGMYTQIRGWLCIDSMGNGKDYQSRLDKVREIYKAENINNDNCSRPYVSDCTWVHNGANGSAWIFIGLEHKNYDDSFYIWLDYLLKEFPQAEGRVDIQYEGEELEDQDKTKEFLIRDGKIVARNLIPVWCYGYGGNPNFR